MVWNWADGKGEDGIGGTKNEAIEDFSERNSRSNGEEAEGKGRRDSENGKVELGTSRESEEFVRGESNLEGPCTNQRNHCQLPTNQSGASFGARRRGTRGRGGRRAVKLWEQRRRGGLRGHGGVGRWREAV